MEKLKSYSVFKKEMDDLVKLQYASKFAFHKVGAFRNFIKIKKNKRYLDDNGFDTKPSGISSFDKKNILKLEKMLNQQTFVRTISALEMFLVDIFRDIFIKTKTPFKDQSKILKLNHSQLLSTKNISELNNQIINKVCRDLSSIGFSEIIKAYKKMLLIDLLHILPGKQKMVEYHEIRHLIVHKLGRTDSQFRIKYKMSNKAGISINDDYLKNFIKDINDFANQVHELVMIRLNDLLSSNIQRLPFERKVIYRIDVLESNSNLNFLNAEFEFWFNDELELLKNILIDKKTLSENEFELELAGTYRQIKAYSSCLKHAKKNKIINLIIVENICNGYNTNELGIKKLKSKYIEEDTLELIKRKLPKQPWQIGIHKKIAEEIGLKNSVVNFAIKILIKKGFFKQQINGKLIKIDENKI